MLTGVQTFGKTVLVIAFLLGGALEVRAGEAEKPPDKWHGPFGGTFNANVTVTSDYSYAGISNNALQPAYQLGLDYRTPDLTSEQPLWLYLSGFGSNVTFSTGPGLEVDVAIGVKLKPTERLKIDLGYVRISFPGTAAALGYDYGDFGLNVDYDFGPATLSGRLRASPNSFANSGRSLNKRGLLSVPLSFAPFGDQISFKGYGSLGNLSVERYQAYGLPSSDYWYWQFGLVVSSVAYGLDMTFAYTDTSISPEGCGYSGLCAGRVFVSLTKTF
jgi:uncharacterized protein (TIGR02001 family)